jgi:pimeloyl-ACP methyl ester carboxylesterase
MPGQLWIPTADTRLSAFDTPGGDPPVLFINGGFGTTRDWNPVVTQLAGKYRTVRFDARARGKSGTSADYSMAGAVADVGTVIKAAGLDRPVLVGWSHGATTAVRFAAENPDQVSGLVLIDGGYPITAFDQAGREKVRAQFGRLGWIMRILAAAGRSARIAPAQSADLVIEMDELNGRLGADFAALQCPAVFIVGTGKHSGATEDEMKRLRAAAADATAANPQVSVFATVPVNHLQILRKATGTVIAAIGVIAAART